jgi:hypothetical protein
VVLSRSQEGMVRVSSRRKWVLRLTVVLAVATSYAMSIRPRMLTWGATAEETTGTYAGDTLIPDPDGGATMAMTLPAPPEETWRWLVQMGGERAGWYSWDWLDNGGEPSADRIVQEWQTLEVGHHLRRPPISETNWWTVVVLEPNRTMVLQTSYGPTGRSFDPQTGHVPWSYTEGIWGFHLREAPNRGTRLVVRTRNRSRPRLLNLPLTVLVGEPVHFVMQARQLRNLRARMGECEVLRDIDPPLPGGRAPTSWFGRPRRLTHLGRVTSLIGEMRWATNRRGPLPRHPRDGFQRSKGRSAPFPRADVSSGVRFATGACRGASPFVTP